MDAWDNKLMINRWLALLLSSINSYSRSVAHSPSTKLRPSWSAPSPPSWHPPLAVQIPWRRPVRWRRWSWRAATISMWALSPAPNADLHVAGMRTGRKRMMTSIDCVYLSVLQEIGEIDESNVSDSSTITVAAPMSVQASRKAGWV